MTEKYTWIKEQESGYQKPIALTNNWSWSLNDHLRRSFLYKHSQFETDNEDRVNRPFKNIITAIQDIRYRTEGFDVKDIELYVNNSETYHKSFLVKKFHEKWALENEMDTLIDDIVESSADYDLVLVKKGENAKPEIVDLLSLAFCDQTNILGGPFAIKHYFSPDELREMSDKGWGNNKNGATIDIETLIKLSEPKKSGDSFTNQNNTTPGKYIEIYEIHGTLPENWLNKREYDEEGKYVSQIQICAFYKNKDDKDIGVSLFSSIEPKLPFKKLVIHKVHGRAAGSGGIERLFEPQIWTNYGEIQMQEMLEIASKTFYKTTDPRFKTRNSLLNSENGQIFDLQEGKDINQIDTTPRNIVIFDNAVRQWQQHAELLGAAGDALQGQNPSSGTPFKLQELVTMEAKGLHNWRQGKIAVFMDEIYRDWILPHIKKEITKGKEFLAELSMDELQQVSERIIENQANKLVKEKILNGEIIKPEQVESFRAQTRERFLKGGLKRFLKILKDEFNNEELDVLTNIANKQKNLALLTDKIVNVIRQFIATPEIRQDPGMVKLLNVILESSGLSPIMFAAASTQLQQGGGSTESLKELGELNKRAAPARI